MASAAATALSRLRALYSMRTMVPLVSPDTSMPARRVSASVPPIAVAAAARTFADLAIPSSVTMSVELIEVFATGVGVAAGGVIVMVTVAVWSTGSAKTAPTPMASPPRVAATMDFHRRAKAWRSISWPPVGGLVRIIGHLLASGPAPSGCVR